MGYVELKERMKKIGTFLCRYINGVKGAVSLLLAFVMTPMLTIALLLVESARYQNVVELVKEITGLSSFSTLANYDSMLEDRFGLMGISQQTDINQTFGQYMEENMHLLGNAADLGTVTASGKLALSDTKVLKQQLLEYSELTVVAETVSEGLDLSKLLEKMEEALNLDGLNKEIEKVQAGADLAKEVTSLVKAIKNIKSTYNDYSKALTEYREAYTSFKDDILELEEELEDAEDKLKEDEAYDSIYEKWGVKLKISDAKGSRDTYKKKNENLQEKLGKLRDGINGIITAANNLPAKLQKVKDADDDSNIMTNTTMDWVYMIADQVTDNVKKSVGDKYYDNINGEISALSIQVTALNAFGNKTVTTSWTEQTVKQNYGTISIKTVSSQFLTIMTNLILKLEEKPAASNSQQSSMGNMLKIVEEVLSVQLLYDSALNAKVSNSYMYSPSSLSFSDKATIDSLTLLVTACEDFKTAIKDVNIVKALEAFVKLLASVGAFLVAVVAWIANTLGGLISLIASGPKEIYNTFILYGYGIYNMPNRLTCTSKSTVSGYKYINSFNMAGGKLSEYQKGFGGSLKNLAKETNQSGSAKMFKGAVSEYLLVGANSERMNQSVTFVKIYLLRLALDIYNVFTNPQITALSAAAGPGAMLVKVAIAMVQPLLDTIFLVNGVDQYLINPTMYFTYQGAVILQQNLIKCSGVSSNLKKMLGEAVTNANGKPGVGGTFEAGYGEHILILMIAVKQDEFIKRIKNVIQMEGSKKYENSGGFKLSKAYTYVQANVNYELNPMFTLEGLTDHGAFTGKVTKYTGY